MSERFRIAPSVITSYSIHYTKLYESLPERAAETLLGSAPEALCRRVEQASGGVLGALSLLGTPRAFPLQRLAAQRPDEPAHWLTSGTLLEHAGRLEESEEHFRRALELEPQNASALNSLVV